MTKVRIIGRKPHVEAVLHRLYRLRLLQLASAHEEPALELASFPGAGERAELAGELRLLVAQLEGLLKLAGASSGAGLPGVEGPPAEPVDAAEVTRELRAL